MSTRFKLIQQHDERDCGAACLAMVSGYYGHQISLAEARELTKTDRMGTNVYGLVDGAEQLGLKATALSGGPSDLGEALERGDVTYPFVALMCKNEELMHYVVVVRFDGRRLLVADPSGEKQRLTPDEFFAEWTGCVVTFKPGDDFGQASAPSKRKKFFSLLKGQSRRLVLVLALSLIVSGIGIAGAFSFQLATANISDSVESAQEAEGGATAEVHDHEAEHDHEHEGEPWLFERVEALLESLSHAGLDVIFAMLLGLYLLQSVVQVARGRLIIALSRDIDVRLSLDYYNHLVGLPIASLATRQTGEYLSRLSDTSTVRNAISEATITLVMDSLMVVACGAILLSLNTLLFCIALVMVALYAIIVLCFRKTVEETSRKSMEADASVQSLLKETVDGMETIKASGASATAKSRIRQKYGVFIEAAVRSSHVALTQESLTNLIEAIGMVLILWSGFVAVSARVIDLGTLMTFYAMLAYFTEPIKNLIKLQPTIQKAFVAIDRLDDVLLLREEAEDGFQEVGERIDNVVFEDVSFRYGNRELVLKDVSFDVSCGQRLAIVGESGSGKTTLARLLLRFYDAESGDILVNGRAIDTYSANSLRNAIAYVDQNTFLFSDTILNNVRLGCPNASEDEVRKACRLAKADAFIERLPFGYDTILDENGMNLSGGQRQRLAIARALLRKPKLLILDEATSNLDTITEQGIDSALFGMSEDFACIVIAHRLSTVKNCDKIVVMHEGSVAELGTHEELVAQKGMYYEMLKRQ